MFRNNSWILGVAALIYALVVASQAARAAEDEPAASDPTRGYLAVGLLGGTVQTQAPVGLTSLASGAAELDFGFRQEGGLGLALVGQSLDLEDLPSVDERRHFTGGTLGARATYERGAFSVWGAAGAGSLRRDDDLDDAASRLSHDIFTGSFGLGLALIRGRTMDLRLVGEVGATQITSGVREDERLGARLWRQQLGVVMSFYPGASSDPVASSSFNCWDCGRLVADGGKLLLDGGAALGRAASGGVFQLLRGIR